MMIRAGCRKITQLEQSCGNDVIYDGCASLKLSFKDIFVCFTSFHIKMFNVIVTFTPNFSRTRFFQCGNLLLFTHEVSDAPNAISLGL